MAVLSREIAFPLAVDSSGGFATITDPSDVAASHVRTVLGTERGERVMSADYGTPTLEHLFRNVTDEEISDVQNDVADALAAWAPEVNVASISVDTADSTVSVTVEYSLAQAPDSTQTVAVTLPVEAG